MKLRKILTIFAGALAVIPMVSCGGQNNPTTTTTPQTETNTGSTQTSTTSTETVYSKFVAAEVGEEVTIEGYVQAKQSWWDNKATVYLQDDNGGYFVYELACTEAQYNTDLAIGNKISVTGEKAEYGGQVEVYASKAGAEGTWTKLSGTKTYEAKKLNKLADMKNNPNMLVKLDLTVASNPEVDPKRDNIYYDVTDGENVYTFCVETYLTGRTGELHDTVKGLKIGDKITTEGFAYTYYDPQLHTTKVTKLGTNVFTKGTGVMSHAEFNEAEVGADCVVEGFVAAKFVRSEQWQSTNLYLQDAEGGYYVYSLPVTVAQYNSIKVGDKIKVTGQKAEWQGEVEIDGSKAGAEGTFEIIGTEKFLSKSKDLSSILGDADELKKHNNEYVYLKGLEIVSISFPKGDGGDTEVKVKYTPAEGAAVEYTFFVETDLTPNTTETYNTVKGLKAGDKVNLYGFMYIYGGPQLQITKVEK